MARITRRHLMIGTAVVAGGGLALTWLRPDASRARLAGDAAVLEPNAFLQLAPDGTITVQVDKAELGQGVMTAWVTLVAEELDVPPAAITARFAPVHPLFQDPTMVTAESASMKRRWLKLRSAGATARAMLLQAASASLGVDIAALDTDGTGRVRHAASNRHLRYAELAEVAARLPVPDDVPLRSLAAFRYIGGTVPRVDIPAKVRGTAGFGLDVRVPGMKVAMIARPAEFGAVPAGWDEAAALALPGVRAVVRIASGLAVVADDTWQASRGVAALAPTWTRGPIAGVGTAWVHGEQRRLLATEPGDRVRDDGDADAALGPGEGLIEVEYQLPYLAHAPMEPMNCTVALAGDRCEVWAPNQGADMVRQVVCNRTGLPRASVVVHSTYSGGGFGRRAILDYVDEAVEIAAATRETVDSPIQLVWSRTDDLRYSWFRQATTHRLAARLDAAGKPLAWRHRLVAGSLSKLLMPVIMPIVLPESLPRPAVRGLARAARAGFEWSQGAFQARDGSATVPYAIPNLAVDIITWDPGVPIGIWRSVGNSYNAFVVESFVDELAAQAGTDPAVFRRELLDEQPRHRAVLDALVERAGWGRATPGRTQGLALHAAFGSVVGQVAEVSIGAGGRIRVHRVTCVVDCGLAINPDIVRQQMEGGIVFGLTAALYGEVPLENGRALVGNFDDYRMVTLAEAPEIDVHIAASEAEVGGIGETAVPPIAPAVANAVFRATGQRLRALPLRLPA